MQITMTSTENLTELDGVTVRLWEGETLKGTKCKVFVHRIAVHNDEDSSQFEQELKEQFRVSAGRIREVGKNREIVIILEPPNLLYFRAKGCRKRYSLTAEACYLLAVKADVADKKRQKARNKKIKRGSNIRFKASSRPLSGQT